MSGQEEDEHDAWLDSANAALLQDLAQAIDTGGNLIRIKQNTDRRSVPMSEQPTETTTIDQEMDKALRQAYIDPEPRALPLLAILADRACRIITGDPLPAERWTEGQLNSIAVAASRYGSLGLGELRALVSAGAPFREDLVARLPESHRQAAVDEMRRPPTTPDFWPGPIGYAVHLFDELRVAEAEQDGTDARHGYLLGLRVAAGFYGLPGGLPDNVGEADDSRAWLLDLMPIFPIKAKDELALPAIRAYLQLCDAAGLPGQAGQVELAIEEVVAWQLRHPNKVHRPDHEHVPATTVPRVPSGGCWCCSRKVEQIRAAAARS